MLTDHQINELTDAVASGQISEAQALALAREAAFGAAAPPAATPPAPPADPWAKFKAKDSRIDLEALSDSLKRNEGMSDLQALQTAIKMNGEDAAPLVAAERQRFEERATAAAKQEFFNTPEGIEALGNERRAAAEALKQRADNMRPELAARGLPVEDMSDADVVGMIEDMAEERAAVAAANSLEANLAHIAAQDTARGEGQ